MKASFQGQLDEGVLMALLTYLSINAASGSLQLRERSGASAEVFFSSGRLVHAQLGSKAGPRALAQLLTWTAGRYSFRLGVSSPAVSIRISLDMLLKNPPEEPLEAQLDESSVLTPRPQAETLSTVLLTVRDLQLLSALDGHKTLREVAFELTWPAETVLALAETLYRQEVVMRLGSGPLEPSFVKDVVRVAQTGLGSLAEIVLEESLFELGLQPEALYREDVSELLALVAAAFETAAAREAFLVEMQEVGSAYGIAEDSS